MKYIPLFIIAVTAFLLNSCASATVWSAAGDKAHIGSLMGKATVQEVTVGQASIKGFSADNEAAGKVVTNAWKTVKLWNGPLGEAVKDGVNGGLNVANKAVGN